MNVYSDIEPSLQKAALIIRELRERLNRAERGVGEPIAVIGMACRFPGDADDPERFWQLLEAGGDAITEIPPEREAEMPWRDSDTTAADGGVPRFGGFVRDCDRFDAAFFGLTAREAATMDPQHRLLLEESWHALEDAGIDPLSVRGSETGVFVGIASNDYAQILLNRRDYGAYYLTGNPLNAAAGRLAFSYGLQGPCLAVDTACSASLVAVHQACQALRGRECTLALAAGVNLVLLPLGGIILARAGMLAPGGRCKTLDAAADGYVRGEGCGIVVLKRLADALRDGDCVRAVLRGSAVNHGGQSAGFTVPSGAAQRAVIEKALTLAKAAPADIGYVELHGTGTQLGDPIEVRALATALAAGRLPERPVVIGSVKSNIGHLEAAAGIAGLIKTALAIEHGRIPATLHVHAPNPEIPWADLPVSIARQNRAWPPGPRIAGVSSFGASGTNAHLVVAAPEPVAVAPAARAPREVEPLLISARSQAALVELARRHAAALARLPAADFSDYAVTAATARAHLPHRLAVVAADPTEAAARLGAFARGEEDAAVHNEVPHLAKLVMVLAEKPPLRLASGMPAFDRAVAECGARMGDVVSLHALGRLWLDFGLEPAMLAGSGPGLYVAAVLAGALDLDTVLQAPANAELRLAKPRLPLFDGDGTALGEGSLVTTRPVPPVADLIARLGATTGLWLGAAAPAGAIAADGDDPPWTAVARQLAALFVAGAPLDWRCIYPRGQGRRIALPHYPFARERHWAEPAATQQLPPGAPAGTDLAAVFERQLAETAAVLTRVVNHQLAALAPAAPPRVANTQASLVANVPDLLLAGADTADALTAELVGLAGRLREMPADRWPEAARRSRLEARGSHRAMLIATGLQAAADAIGAKRRVRIAEARNIRVAYLFPGLGEQHPGMAKGLYDRCGSFRGELDRLCDLAAPLVFADLREIMFTPAPAAKRNLHAMLRQGPEPADPAGERLARPLFAHSAIFLVELALARLWQTLGLAPAALAGYSVGEYSTACVAGVIDERAALELVVTRARLIETAPAGGMLAAAAGPERLQPMLGDDIWIAAAAAPELTVLSGAESALAVLCPRLSERGVVHRRLAAGHAFHTPQMAVIAEPFRAAVARTELRAPRIPYLGNLTGNWVTSAQVTDPDWWVRHAMEPVRFSDALARLLADPEMAVVEVGPGQSLTSFAHQFPRSAAAPRLAVPSLRAANDEQSDVAAFLNAAGQLWLAGAPIDWAW
jgi:acyl transferase domain-containing protein